MKSIKRVSFFKIEISLEKITTEHFIPCFKINKSPHKKIPYLGKYQFAFTETYTDVKSIQFLDTFLYFNLIDILQETLLSENRVKNEAYLRLQLVFFHF